MLLPLGDGVVLLPSVRLGFDPPVLAAGTGIATDGSGDRVLLEPELSAAGLLEVLGLGCADSV